MLSCDDEIGHEPNRHSYPLKRTALLEASSRQRTDLCDPVVVPIDVDNANAMVKGSLCDQQVRNGCAVPTPHPMVMSEVALERKGAIEDVERRRKDIKAVMEFLFECV